MFIRNFDRDEWDSITNFYDKCTLIDELIKYNNGSFWNDVEQIRANKQRVLADYARKYRDELSGDPKSDEKKLISFDETTDEFNEVYMRRQWRFGYTPDKGIIDARQYLAEIDLGISNSNIGAKLKVLANLKD